MKNQDVYKMRSVTRLTGLSPAVLRAWENRYQLVTPQRSDGGQRLYSSEDVRILQHAQALLQQGRSIGEVVRLGREALLRPVTASPLETRGLSPVEVARDTGPLRDEWVRAAQRVDGGALDRCLDQAFALVSADRVIEEVIEPGMRIIGDRWAQGTCSIAGEHLATGIASQRLQTLVSMSRRCLDPGMAPILCACFPGEEHALGLLIIQYRLMKTGLPVVNLGGNVPLEDVEHACVQQRPRAVALSVSRGEVLRRHARKLLDILQRRGREFAFVIGGSGIDGHASRLIRAGARVWDPGCSLVSVIAGF